MAEQMAIKENKYRALRITLDILSALFVSYFFIYFPLWCHFSPVCVNHSHFTEVPIQFKLIIADIPFGGTGIFWLLLRCKKVKIDGKLAIYDQRIQALLIAAPFIPLLAYVVTRINS